MAYEACRIAIEHMTPVFLLSDGYIANGAEPWRYPTSDTLKPINVTFAKERLDTASAYLPYKRDEKLVREWALPGTKGVEHRLGGLEKDKETGKADFISFVENRFKKLFNSYLKMASLELAYKLFPFTKIPVPPYLAQPLILSATPSLLASSNLTIEFPSLFGLFNFAKTTPLKKLRVIPQKAIKIFDLKNAILLPMLLTEGLL